VDKDVAPAFDLWKLGTPEPRLICVRVQVFQPETIEEALRVRVEVQDAVAVAGGTEVMPARSQGRRRGPLLDLSRVGGMRDVGDQDLLRLGAGVTCTQLIEQLAEPLPALALAAQTVGSRQIRNRATLGGALALADPSADLLAALLVMGGEVEVASVAGARRVGLEKFFTGPYASNLRDEELITAVHVRPARGPAAYGKIGARNAMARAACAVAVALDLTGRRAAIALAAVGPTPLRAATAEAIASAELPWEQTGPLDSEWLERIGALAARDAAPRSDSRGSSAYKRHAVAILSARVLARAWRGRSEWG
jgi:CO/xanthine dehydrogenase FAD-binding subunit